jgi:GT2 family glycosyltransferase/glycosyltransferase involved in cell wall biosynthesis
VLNIQVEQSAVVAQSPTSVARKVLIAIPFYKNEDLVQSVVGSLMDCAADIAAIGGEIVMFDDSPDYQPLAQALEAILPKAQALFPCRLERNATNLGFVKTMNRAVAEAVERKADLILLNSDTVVHPGALTEMARVARLDPMIAFVNPRSDNATLATLPAGHRVSKPQGGFDIAPYTALAAKLPDFSYVPTAVGFCLLIRWHILAEFGGFDEIFGAGYNEENDLVMRAGRCGYRAVLANKAFVQHESERSFSLADIPKANWERVNRAILDARYPEYSAFTAAYFVSPETTAEWLLSTLVPDDAGRLDLALDFSSFAPRHAGTYQAGRQLLQSAVADWSDRFNIHVLCSEEVYEFHNYAELGVPRRDPNGPEKFAVIFREGQPYDWKSVERLVLKGAVIGIHMLDTISLDCTQLTSQSLHNIWQFALARGDFFVTPSGQSMKQIVNRFDIPERVTRVTSLLSLDLNDYQLNSSTSAAHKPSAKRGTLLVIGNHFPHKYLVPTANVLANAFADRKVVALGQNKPSLSPPFNPYGLPSLSSAVNLVGIEVGHYTDAEFAAFYLDAEAVVFPSHYEGFGYPVLNALAARRPIFVRRLPVFEELWEGQARNPNIHFYETTADLVEQLRVIPAWQEPAATPQADNGTARSAREIRAGLETALAKADYRTIVERVRSVQFVAELSAVLESPTITPSPSHSTEIADKAAYYLAVRVEWLARRLFRRPAVFRASRAMYRHVVRPGLRLWRQRRR